MGRASAYLRRPVPTDVHADTLIDRATRGRAAAWMLLAAVALGTLFAWLVVWLSDERRVETAFEAAVDSTRQLVERRMVEYESVLRGGSGLLAASDQVVREEWSRYAEALELERRIPGIQGLGYAAWVAAGDTEAFEARMRAAGVEDFAVHPPPPRDRPSVLIQYLEPLDARNRRALGFDMYSEPVRRAALDRARATGLPALTGGVRLVQEDGRDEQRGVLLYVPVFGAARADLSPGRAPGPLQGFVYAPFRMADLMRGILPERGTGLEFEVFDGEAMDSAQRLYSSASRHGAVQPEGDDEPTRRLTRVVDLPGRTWTLRFSGDASFDAAHASGEPVLVAAGGLALNLLLFWLVRSIAQQRQSMMERAAEMTQEIAARRRTEDELRHSEERFRLLVSAVRDYAIVLLDGDGRVTSWNGGAEALTGWSVEEIIGQPLDRLYDAAATRDGQPARDLTIARSHGRHDTEAPRVRRDGTRFWAHVLIRPVLDDHGALRGFAQVIRDITERRRIDEERERLLHREHRARLETEQAEQALRHSEQRFRQVVELAPSAIVMIDGGGSIVLVNTRAEEMFGYQRDDLLGKQIDLLVPERFRARHPDLRRMFFGAPQSRAMGAGRDLYALRADGSEFPVEIGLTPIETAEGTMVLSVIVDITARKATQAQVEAALREKTVLLNEVHHRVKNNLQVITSLLSLQARNASAEAQAVLNESQSRIKAMALIHQLLYERKDFSRLHLGQYLDRLGRLMADTWHGRDPVTLQVQGADAEVYLDLQRAIPCGLLINELVTNAFKHAFPGGRRGTITVQLAGPHGGVATLGVEDDGIGLPAGFDPDRATSLGFQLVPLLVDQLGATMRIEQGRGTRFVLEFPVDGATDDGPSPLPELPEASEPLPDATTPAGPPGPAGPRPRIPA